MPLVNLSEAEIGIYTLCGDTKSPQPQIEFDLNQFRDPLGNMDLRKTCADGRCTAVQEWIKLDPRFAPILHECIILAHDKIHTGGKWLSIGFRDYHGTWISRAVGSLIASELGRLGYKVGILHAAGQD